MTQSTRSSGEPTIELYRILPVFKDSMLSAVGILAPLKTAQAMMKDNPTPQNWTALFRNEMEWQLTKALRTGQTDEEGLNLLAERWLTERAAAEVIGTPLTSKAGMFADLVVSGGMLIDPEAPYQVVREYLQARLDQNRDRMEEILKQNERRSYELRITTDEFLALPPMERLEIMLANLTMRGPSGGLASPRPLPHRTMSGS